MLHLVARSFKVVSLHTSAPISELHTSPVMTTRRCLFRTKAASSDLHSSDPSTLMLFWNRGQSRRELNLQSRRNEKSQPPASVTNALPPTPQDIRLDAQTSWCSTSDALCLVLNRWSQVIIWKYITLKGIVTFKSGIVIVFLLAPYLNYLK